MNAPHRDAAARPRPPRSRARLAVAALVAATSFSALAAGTAQADVNFDQGTRISLPGLTGAGPIAIADFDGDGHRDFVVGGATALQVGLYDTPGHYVFSTYSGFGHPVTSIVTGDFNGDTIPDVAALFQGGGVTVFAGQTGVPNQVLVPTPVSATTPDTYDARLAAGDVDGDGDLDLAVTGTSADSFKILSNDGTGTFTDSAPVYAGSDSQPVGIALADINGDGPLDVITANSGNTRRDVSVFINQPSSPRFSAHNETATDIGAGGLEITTGNFIGDPNTDVLLTSFNQGYSVLKGNGSPAMDPGVLANSGATNQGLAVADFDANGTTDVATWDRSGSNPRNLFVRSLDPDSGWVPSGFHDTFQVPEPINGSTLYEDYPVAADMDNDGRPDVVMADSADHSLTIMSADTHAPEAVISSGPDAVTNDPSPTFAYDVATPESSNVTFECRLTGPGQSATWAACGQTQAPPSSREQSYTDLADGDYTFEVRATDVAANVQQTPAASAFTVDTSAPDTALPTGPSGTVDTDAVTFDLGTPEHGATFECRLDGPAGALGTWAPCTSPASFTGLANGDYTLNVRAADGSGNADATPATRTFTIAKASGGTGGGGGATTTPAPTPTPVPSGTGNAPAPKPAPVPAAPHAGSPLGGLPAVLTLAADGTVRVPVAGSANAKGRLVIITTQKYRIANGPRARRNRNHRVEKIVLAARQFTVSPSGKVSLKVVLSKKFRQSLKGLTKVGVTVKVTVDGHTSAKKVTLALPKAGARK